MSLRPPGDELGNDPEGNPCFGCGPRNPAGLQLRFFDDGEAVRAPLELDERFAGWPGGANFGIVFTAMLEACTWVLWERLGPAQMAGSVTFEPVSRVQLGVPAMVEGRLASDGGGFLVEMRCLQNGEERARAEMPARRAMPEEAKAMLDAVPSALRPGYEVRAGEAGGEASR